MTEKINTLIDFLLARAVYVSLFLLMAGAGVDVSVLAFVTLKMIGMTDRCLGVV